MNDTIITVRMPKSLLKSLRQLSELQHYMDISEAIRSILRKEYMNSNAQEGKKDGK